MDTPNKMGVTRRQTLLDGRRQLLKAGKSQEEVDELFSELAPVKVVRGTEGVVNAFNQLSARRSSGMGGPQPLSFSEIKAYDDLTDSHLTPWEVDALCAMDAAFLNATYSIIDSERG